MKRLKPLLLKHEHVLLALSLFHAVGLLALLLVLHTQRLVSYKFARASRKLAKAKSAPTHAITKSSGATAAFLFATKRSPGAIAVGAAEGNYTTAGTPTSIYFGHTDPGNHVTNRGFCSWNGAANLTVAEADRRCLDALQHQAAVTEQKLLAVGIDPKTHVEALVNGTDLWNQSDSAGPQFAVNYKRALDDELTGQEALVGARVEAFRNSGRKLDAGGLFGICATQPYYQSRLSIYAPNSQSWHWECIALDQKRRVKEVHSCLQQHLGLSESSAATKVPVPNLSTSDPPVPLSFPPAVLGTIGTHFILG